jgi:phosphatidylglycerophosphatase C
MSRSGPVVAFDFDGTLTVRDSFTAFLKWQAGPTEYYAGMARLAPAAAAWMIHRNLTRLKAATVNVFLAGLPRTVLEEEAAEFAAVTASAGRGWSSSPPRPRPSSRPSPGAWAPTC